MKTPESTVGQIVSDDYRTAHVFRNFGIDFCCGGNKTLDEACSQKGVDPNKVKEALKDLRDEKEPQHNFNDWSPDFLIDYIINNHHNFTRRKLPEIEAYSQKVAKVHGKRHPELNEIADEIIEMHKDISDHLDKEEKLLFPYIKVLIQAEKNKEVPKTPDFGTAADPISMMEQEHDEAGKSMAKIRRLSDDFTPPEDACTTYRILFQNLEAFEKDLHKHVHLENNILFPKALELEKRLN